MNKVTVCRKFAVSPLVRYPDFAVTLPLRYFGSVDYYAVMAAFGTVIIDDVAPFNKRDKGTHRCTIADTHGELLLTVPVAKAKGAKTWHDIAVSDHGDWWQDFEVSVASAYGRTPFHEYYIDRLRQYFSRDVARSGISVAALDCSLDRAVRQILGITSSVVLASELPPEERIDSSPLPETRVIPYYQVRQTTQCFHPHMSILDLIFNMGPEAPLILQQMLP